MDKFKRVYLISYRLTRKLDVYICHIGKKDKRNIIDLPLEYAMVSLSVIPHSYISFSSHTMFWHTKMHTIHTYISIAIFLLAKKKGGGLRSTLVGKNTRVLCTRKFKPRDSGSPESISD